MKRFFAFTLAETLIVMGIIGIVSALTLPNLNSSTGEKEKVAKVKKIYQNLTDALGRAQAVYGPIDEWIQTSDSTMELQSTRIGERITEFIKVGKTCGIAVNKGCFTTNVILDYDNSVAYDEDNDNESGVYKIITADGTSIGFMYDVSQYCSIYVDLDGPNKGKNRAGEDRFVFYANKNGVFPWDLESDRSGNFESYDVDVWAIENDNMDYLKCADELNWETKRTCK